VLKDWAAIPETLIVCNANHVETLIWLQNILANTSRDADLESLLPGGLLKVHYKNRRINADRRKHERNLSWPRLFFMEAVSNRKRRQRQNAAASMMNSATKVST